MGRSLALLFFALVAAGCDCVPCPDGYACVTGHCVRDPSIDLSDLSVAPPAEEVDLAVAASKSDLRLADLASHGGAPQDLRAIQDLATPPQPDLGKGCVKAGGSCYYHKDSVCCSHYCTYKTNECK